MILALDISGSMRARDIAPSRFEAAKAAARAFIEKQPHNVRVGIVAFSATAALVQPPTRNHDDLFAAMDRLRPQRGTAIGSGILVSLDAILEDAQGNPSASVEAGGHIDPNAPAPSVDQPLAAGGDPSPPDMAPGSNASAVVVLLTDGQNNTGPDPLDVADQAAKRGIRVFTVGIGTNGGDIVGAEGRFFRVALDEPGLKKIAQNTAASYFKADNERDLIRIYQGLSVRLTMGRDTTEITAILTAIALAVLVVGAALSLLWFNRVP